MVNCPYHHPQHPQRPAATHTNQPVVLRNPTRRCGCAVSREVHAVVVVRVRGWRLLLRVVPAPTAHVVASAVTRTTPVMPHAHACELAGVGLLLNPACLLWPHSHGGGRALGGEALIGRAVLRCRHVATRARQRRPPPLAPLAPRPMRND